MTYGTSHLLIGVGAGGGGGEGIFRGRVKKKYCCEGGHHMKNKSTGGCVLLAQPDQQKRPQCKNAQKMQKNIKH